ncbi:tetratricopeptide repeat protein [Xanthobacter sp. KR7-225]|uniref:tetratricopeptide repeat protein n=1 Tax=Xanthobacter sp. KR7-225 TaxID=3156613 RepID=UPI0032B4285C
MVRQLGDEFDPDTPAWDLERERPSSVDAMRTDMAALRERLAQAAPRRAVLEMDRAISLLNRRFEDMRLAGESSRAKDSLAIGEELGKLRAALDGLQAPERFQALAAGVDALSRKLDAVASKQIDAVEIVRLQRQTEEMKSLAQRALAPGGLQDMAERIAACADKMMRSSEDLARRMGEATAKFELSAEALMNKVGQFEASYILGGHANAEELRRGVSAEVGAINARLDRVAAQVTALSPAATADMSARLGAILTRMERAGGNVDKIAVAPLTEAMENHLATLTERVRDTQSRLGQLDKIEEAVARVAAEMERVRAAATEAAAEAAEAVALKVSENADGPAVLGIKRGLAVLEARQEEMERRIADAFEADPDERAPLGRAAHDDALWTAGPESVDEAILQDEPAPRQPRAKGADAPRQPRRPAPDQAAAHEARARAKEEARTREEARAKEEARARAEAAEPQPDAERPRRVRLDPAPEPRARAVDPDDLDAPGPNGGRRVDWQSGGAERRMRRERARQERASFVQRRERRRRVVLKAMIAGAVLLIVTTAAGLALQALPGGSAALDGVKMQISGLLFSPVRDLPAPVGPAALQVAARAGDVAAAYAVGVRYADGIGATADPKAAEKWLAYAVSAGSAPAAYRLGSLYENVARNLAEARRFYEWAAGQGNVRAMHNLGVVYSQGIDGKPDWARAIEWFRKSAEMGQADSQYNLGVIYARGLAGPADLAEAWKWFALAASQGDADSATKRDSLIARADPAAMIRARQAAESFKPMPLDPAANFVDLKPDWGMESGSSTVARQSSTTGSRAL